MGRFRVSFKRNIAAVLTTVLIITTACIPALTDEIAPASEEEAAGISEETNVSEIGFDQEETTGSYGDDLSWGEEMAPEDRETVSADEETLPGDDEEGKDDPLSEAIYPQYLISFDANGGTTDCDATSTVTKGLEGLRARFFPVPVLSGYTCMGWFTEPDGGDGVGRYTHFNEDTTLYAHWKANKGIVLSDFTETIRGGRNSSLWLGNYEQSLDPQSDENNPSFLTEPVNWHVLWSEGGNLYLLSDRILDVKKFHPDENFQGMNWDNSVLRSWMNGYGPDVNCRGIDYTDDNFKNRLFDERERNAIPVTQFDVYAYEGVGLAKSHVNDQIFLLTYPDARSTSYGFGNYDEVINLSGAENDITGRRTTDTDYTAAQRNAVGNTASSNWWLLTTSPKEFYEAGMTYVDFEGYVHEWNDYWRWCGIRPAINLNLNSVSFVSSATGGKDSGSVGSGALKRIRGNAGTDWKLTLKDDGSEYSVGSGHSGFQANLTTGVSSLKPGDSIGISYWDPAYGQNEYVSAMLCNEDGEPVWYGRIAHHTSASSGTENAEIKVPQDTPNGKYKLKVFAEQYNGDRKTDYVSRIYQTEVTVTDGASPTPAPSPTPTPTRAPTPTPTATPTDTPTATPSSTPTSTATITPTSTPTSTPSATPSATPTSTPTSTSTGSPTTTPTGSPTTTPTTTPTGSPTTAPTILPPGPPTAPPDRWGEIPSEIRDHVFENAEGSVPDGIWCAFRSNDGKWHSNAEEVHKTYTGSSVTFKDDLMVFHGTRQLFEKKDYTVKYANNKKAAAADANKPPTVTIYGTGNYNRKASFKFNIDRIGIGAASVNMESRLMVSSGKKLSTVQPKVTFGNKKLKKNTDYELVYYEGERIDAEKRIANPSSKVMEEGGTYLLCLKGKGNFNGEAPAVVIRAENGKSQKIVSAGKLTVTDTKGKKLSLSAGYNGDRFDIASCFDNGDGKEPAAQIRYGNTILSYGTDYTLSFAPGDDGIDIGKHTIILTGNEEKMIAPDDTTGKIYVGTKKITLTITGTDMKKVKVAGLKKSAVYTGSRLTLEDAFDAKDKNLMKGWNTVTLYTVGKNKKKTALTEDTDYYVSVNDVTESSYAKLYAYPVERYETNGNGQKVKKTTWITGRARSGLYDVVFAGVGGCSGTLTKQVKIEPYDIGEKKVKDSEKLISVTIDDENASYRKEGAIPAVKVFYRGSALREGIDYKLSYSNNKKVVADYTKLKAKERPTVTVTGMGKFKGKRVGGYFNIAKTPLREAVVLSPEDVVYNANGKQGYFLSKPVLTDGGVSLQAGRDKDVEAFTSENCVYTYTENTTLGDRSEKNAGDPVSPTDQVLPGTTITLTVTATCSGKSSYLSDDGGNTMSAAYTVIDSSWDISKAKVGLTREGANKFVYNNCEAVSITEEDLDVRIGATKKKKGEQLFPVFYEIVSVTNNRLTGTSTIVIRGRNGYGGKKKFKVKLGKKALDS